MKTYQTKLEPQPARETKVCTQVKCDLCGKVAPRPAKSVYSSESHWNEGAYEVSETDIRYKSGKSSYPEGGSGEEITIDICPKCFTQKLIPWVKEQGGEPAETDWDW